MDSSKLNKKIVRNFFKQHAKKLYTKCHFKIKSIEEWGTNGHRMNIDLDEFDSGWAVNHQVYARNEDIIKWNLKNRIEKLNGIKNG